jgi:hypothetical protein
VILFGTGKGGQNGYEHIRKESDVIGFCDNNRDKHGTRFCGLPVYAPSELQFLHFERIVICSMHVNAIRGQLEDNLCIEPERIAVLDQEIRLMDL